MRTEVRKASQRQRKCPGLTEQYVTGTGRTCVVGAEMQGVLCRIKKTCSEFAGPRSSTPPSTGDQQKHEMSFFSVKVLVLVKRGLPLPTRHLPGLSGQDSCEEQGFPDTWGNGDSMVFNHR